MSKWKKILSTDLNVKGGNFEVENEQEIQICVEKLNSPVEFYARIVNSENFKAFRSLKKEIKNYFNNNYVFCKSSVQEPYDGQRCIVKTDNGLYHRAKIRKTFVSASMGLYCDCVLLDEFKFAQVPNTSVYHAPDWVWKVPCQSACFGLHGIVPAKLKPDYLRETMNKVACSKSGWDPAACAFLEELCIGRDKVLQAVVMKTDHFGKIWIKLFMPGSCIENERVFLNDELIGMEFAETKKESTKGHTSSNNGRPRFPQRSFQIALDCLSDFSEGPSSDDESVCAKRENDGVTGWPSCNGSESDDTDDVVSEVVRKGVSHRPRRTSHRSSDKKRREVRVKGAPRQPANKKVVRMRSIGSQAGEDSPISDNDGEEHVKRKDFSCQVTKRDLEIFARDARKPVEEPDKTCQKSDKPFDVEPAKRNFPAKIEPYRHDNDLLNHIPKRSISDSDVTSSAGDSETASSVDSDADNNPRKARAPLKSVFVPDKIHTGSVVLVRGHKPPNPYPVFCKTPFSNFSRVLESTLRLRGPKLIQAHAWPAVMEKRDVVAVAPGCGGKMLTYIVPLAHMIIKQAKARNERCEAPLAVVITPNWNRAQKIEYLFEAFLETAERQHKVVTVCGGSSDENIKASRLASGCSVLICSAASFIRICDAKYVNLSSLRHLVFDSAHLLFEEFSEEVRGVMKIVANVLRTAAVHMRVMKPPQIICVGSQWTKGIESFMTVFTKTRPLLLISDPLEAAVFGRVRHKAVMTASKSQLSLLEYLLASYRGRGSVAVFTDNPKSTERLAECFRARGLYTFQAHGSMSHGELDIVSREVCQESTQLVLFATDDVVPHLDVYGIRVVVHLSPPANQHRLGVRLSVMQSLFDSEIEDLEKAGRSIFLIDENNSNGAADIFQFLKRVNQPIPEGLLPMARKALSGDKSSTPLCPTLQFVGECPHIAACRYRHQLSSADKANRDSNFPPVPTAGQVKIRVTHVVDATHYYGVCKAVKHAAGDIDKLEDRRESISDEIKEFLRSADKVKAALSSDPIPGIVYATVKSNERVVPLRLKKSYAPNKRDGKEVTIANFTHDPAKTFVCWTSPAKVRKTCVKYIDTGKVRVVRCDELVTLPESLRSIPRQAVEIRVCGVRPNDRDCKWLPQADEMVHENLFNKDLEGIVVATLGHTMWLSPAVIRSKLPIAKVTLTDFNVGQELLKLKYAQKHPAQVKMLKDFISGEIGAVSLEGKHETQRAKVFPLAPSGTKLKLEDKNKSSEDTTDRLVDSENVKDIVRREASSVDVPIERATSYISKHELDDAKLLSGSCDVSNKESGGVRQLPAHTGRKENKENSSILEPEDKDKISEDTQNVVDFERPDVCIFDAPIKRAVSCLSQLDADDVEVTSGQCDVSNKTSGAVRRLPAPTRQKETVNSSNIEPEDKNKMLEDASVRRQDSLNVEGFERREACRVEAPVERVTSCLSKLNVDGAKVTAVQCDVGRKGSGALHRRTGPPRQENEENSSNIESKEDKDEAVLSLDELGAKFCDEPLSEAQRMTLLLEMHVLAVGSYYDLSRRDIDSLANVLPATRTVKEALIVAGALLSLALDDVPIANCVALVPLVKMACDLPADDRKETRKLAVILFKLSQAIVESLSVNDRVDADALPITSSLEVIIELERYLVLPGDSRVIDEASHLLNMTREHWNDQRKVREAAQDEKNRKPEKAQKKKSPKPVPRAPQQGFNYDRFNDIDTDTTDAESFRRPFTPIPVKFDTDTDGTTDSETM